MKSSLFVLTYFFSSSYSFTPIILQGSKSPLDCRILNLYSSPNTIPDEDVFDDIYGLLDLSKPLSDNQNVLNEYSISESPDAGIIKKPSRPKNDSIEEDLDIDLNNKDSWMVEVCDAMERRLGIF
jgi:hypothetical protein